METPKIIFVHGHPGTGTSFLINDILISIFRDKMSRFHHDTIFSPRYSIDKSKYSKYTTVVLDQQPTMMNHSYDYFKKFLELGDRSLVVLTAFGSLRDDLFEHFSDSEYQDFIDTYDILDIETFRDDDKYLRSFSYNSDPIQTFDGTYSNHIQHRSETQDKLYHILKLERYK